MTRTTQQLLAQQIAAQAEAFDDIYQEDDPFEALWEAPLELRVSEQITVVLCTGGPHVEAAAIVAEGAITSARIDGWWGTEHLSQVVGEGSVLWWAPHPYRPSFIAWYTSTNISTGSACASSPRARAENRFGEGSTSGIGSYLRLEGSYLTGCI